MTIEKVIADRRSIRKFKDKKVPAALIEKLIKAAQLAPSACNSQPSRFVIIENKEMKQKLRENSVFRLDFVYKAPLIIICCGDPEVFPKERSEIAGDIGAVRDISISTQNLVLAAVGLGLGTCYIGLMDRDKIKEILNIPKNYVMPFVIIAGYPDEKPKPKPRKDINELIIAQFV